MPYDHGGNCWHCGTPLSAIDYGRQDSCPKCGRDTKTCRGCEFHDRTQNNECRESQAERVVDKERSNFCDYFRPKVGSGASPNTTKDAQKAAADALFKKK